MLIPRLFAVAAVCLGNFLGVAAVPAPTPTVVCPSTTVVTTSYTGLIEAPGTTYPYTTTVTYTDVSYPLTTETTTETYTFDGEIWVTYSDSPIIHTTTTSYVSTFTETQTFTNYYGSFPGC